EPHRGAAEEQGPAPRRWARLLSVPVAGRWRYPFYLLTCVVFLGIVFVRGGPNPAETDAHAVTFPTTAISHGDLRLAEEETYVPNPPGYPLLMAPVVSVLRPWIGSPRWCDDKAIPAVLRGPGSSYYRRILTPCSRALAVRGTGAVLLLRAAGAGGGVGELVLVGALLVLPATTDAVAQSFHPQDLMSVGFTCAGLSQVLRRRWATAGVAFGAAFLCKQFALLGLIGVLALAPGWRPRLRLVLPAAAVIAAAVVPFYAVDATGTVHALSAVYVSGAGVEKTPTMVGLLGLSEQTKLELARDLPLVAAVGLALALWSRRRRRPASPSEPLALIGLGLACLSLRLVFEVAILDYYFLAVGVFLLVLDVARRRVPLWSVGWVVAMRFGLTWLAPRGPFDLTAAAFLALSLLPVVLGLGVVTAPPGTTSSGAVVGEMR
ncbi:MAG: hypothetical protein ABSG81_16965, partial [Acidimicrobiales bacterium]